MRIRIQRHGLVPAVVVTLVGVAALYVASTWGWATLQDTRSSASAGVGTLPDVVESPPASVATTDQYGPVGPVSMVFAGTDVRDGLFGKVDPVWLAVSSHTGEYRALTVPLLPDPGPGAVSVSPAGDRVAWASEGRLVVYDPASDKETTPSLDLSPTAVGRFSPDGSKLLVYAGGMTVVDLESGRTLSQFEADEETVRRAAWRPDGSAVDFVLGGDLVTGAVPGSDVARQPTDIPGRAQLAWSGAGDRLASLQPTPGARRLFVSGLGRDGRVGPSRPVVTQGISLDRLVGFSGADRIAVVAYALESGAVQRVLDVPLDGGGPSDLTILPGPGENWVGSATLAIATDTLPFGSTEFEERVWPWSYGARLAACALFGLFLLGLYVTRRPR